MIDRCSWRRKSSAKPLGVLRVSALYPSPLEQTTPHHHRRKSSNSLTDAEFQPLLIVGGRKTHPLSMCRTNRVHEEQAWPFWKYRIARIVKPATAANAQSSCGSLLNRSMLMSNKTLSGNSSWDWVGVVQSCSMQCKWLMHMLGYLMEFISWHGEYDSASHSTYCSNGLWPWLAMFEY
jgi:hypothetical protein